MIFSVGTQVVILKDVYASKDRIAHPAGAVGVIVRSAVDPSYAYRIRFNDGFEAALNHDELIPLSHYKRVPSPDETIRIPQSAQSLVARDSLSNSSDPLYERVIYRCVIGSRAYGLDDDQSDTDRRGFYLPPANLQWSLYGVPEQLEYEQTQEAYWEIQKFIILALKANPNVLECLYSPIVELVTPLAEELLAMRAAFLSKLVFQTFSGYVASQFKKMQSDLRNQGQVKWKHVMHLIRLLISGIDVLREGRMILRADEARERLLAIKRGEVEFTEANSWRNRLQDDFERAFRQTTLPDRPDYERANKFLIHARMQALQESVR